MVRVLLAFVLCMTLVTGYGQVSGDFRSRQSGNWNDVNTWERYNGTAWIGPAPSTPTNSIAQAIVVRSPHVVTVTASVAADQMTVSSGATLGINGPSAAVLFTINRSAAGAQDLVVEGTVNISNGSLRIMTSPASVIRVASGGVINSLVGNITNANASRLIFDGGSTYRLNYFSGSLPTASWNIASTVRITGNMDGTNLNLNQTFGNFEWNTPTLDENSDLDGALTRVAGNLNIVNTGASSLYLGYSTPYTLNVGGTATFSSGSRTILTGDANATVNVAGALTSNATLLRASDDTGNATLNVTGATTLSGGVIDAGSSTGLFTMNLSGDYTRTAGQLAKSGSPATGMSMNFVAAGTQNFTSTQVPTFPVNYATSGTSDLRIAATSFLGGTGALTVGPTSTITLLSTVNTGALQANTTAGNVRVAGTRTYNGAVVYGASARQRMAASHPGTANTIIRNAGGVTMLGDVAFTTGTLTLTTGVLRIENNSTLTVATVVQTAGRLGINPTSNLVVNGSGAFNMALTHLSGTAMNNLTINRSGGTVTNATATLVINGTLNLTQGTLALGTSNFTANGPFTVASGAMTSASAGRLTIGGTGAMPAGVSVTGSMNILQMNRPSATLNLTNAAGNNLAVTRLNIYNGSITNAGGLRMANNGNIYRTNGSLTNAIAAVGIYNVFYTNFTAATLPIGFEIPSAGTALNNVTINNTGSGTHDVVLNRVLDVNRTLTITRGGLTTANYDVLVGRNFAIAATGRFTPGTSTVTFNGNVAQTFSGPGTYTISNLIIAKSARSNFTLQANVNIVNSFAITTNRSAVNVGNNRLTLLSTAANTAYIPALFSNTGGGSSITGTVIVQRQLPNSNGTRAYRYITPTVTNSNVSDWQAEFPISGTFSNPSTGTWGGVKIVSANPSLFYWDEPLGAAGSGYVAYPTSGTSATNPLVIGRGYAAFVRTAGPQTYDTRGTLGQNNINVATTSSGGANGGWNLVGNPYPAPIDWDVTSTLNTGSVGSAIYLTDNTNNAGAGAGVSVSYVPGVGGTGTFDGVVASGQAFWVRGAGNVRFRENQKFAGQTGFIREKKPENVLRINMTAGSSKDNILIHLNDSASSKFDLKYDAFKYEATGVNISTLSADNEKLSINSVNKADCNTVIPFDFDGAVTGNYTLDFSGLESFTESVTPVLYDKVLEKRLDITSTTSSYAFSVTDVATLKGRFQLLFESPQVETALVAKGEEVCQGNTFAYIALETSQASVKYTALLNGTTVSEAVSGNGSAVKIPVDIAKLTDGDNEITISAQRLSCDALNLDTKATVTIVNKITVSSANSGTSCGEGTIALSANAPGATTFNWYEDIAGTTSIEGQHGSDFVTPVLAKSRVYYVAAVNSAGCEGERMAVNATVSSVESATITVEGTTLSSNYTTGNQWFIDDIAIAGATGQTIEAIDPGIYSVAVTTENCTTVSAGREMTVMAIEESDKVRVRVYPNPSADKVHLEIKTKEEVRASLITQTGTQISKVNLSGNRDIKTGEFSLGLLPDGVYFIRINEGTKVYTKKVTKIK